MLSVFVNEELFRGFPNPQLSVPCIIRIYSSRRATATARAAATSKRGRGSLRVMMLSLRQAEGDVPSSFAGGPPSHSQLGGAN